MSADPESVAKEVSGRNNTWIGEFVAEDGDPTYFLFIEQQVLFSVNSFSRALFCWFSSYYVFNLEYEKNSTAHFVLPGICFWSPRKFSSV